MKFYKKPQASHFEQDSMFIQCEQCQAKYQIDEGKLPPKKAVVRCSKCSNPIPLPDRSGEQESFHLVACPSCDVQYAVPSDKFKGDLIKASCGKCGHLFTADKHGHTGEIPDATEKDGLLDNDLDLGGDDDFGDDLGGDFGDDLGGDLEGLDGSDLDLGGDFDDLGGDLDQAMSKGTKPSPGDQDYMDSVSLGDDDLLDTDDLDEISDEEAGMFLKASPTGGGDWPDIQEEEGEPEEEDDFSMDDLDPAALPEELPESPKRSRAWLWILLLILLGGAGAYLADRSGYFQPQITEEEIITDSPPARTETRRPNTPVTENRLTLLEPLRGKLVMNQPSNKLVFVLKGKVKSLYPPESVIRQVRIQGSIGGAEGKPMKATSLAGVGLSGTDVTILTPGELKAIYADAVAANEITFTKGLSRTLDFQILFFDPPEDIQTLEAKILSFQLNGAPKIIE